MNGLIAHLPDLSRLAQLESHLLLSGEQGGNRERLATCQIHARNDYEAVKCWLNEYRHKPTTHRAYEKEAERLLLWCVFKQQKALSSLTRDDFESYSLFLSNPEPASFWCGSKGKRGQLRGSTAWRPFVSGLSQSSKATALRIIDSLMDYLTEARYLAFNPMSLIKKRLKIELYKEVSLVQSSERALEPDEWKALLEVLEEMPENIKVERDEKERLRFIVAMLYFLGLRVSELVNHTWGSFQQMNGLWWFVLIGKGDKLGKIPVNDGLLTCAQRFRVQCLKSPLPMSGDNSPLVPSWKTGEAITDRHINYLLKELAMAASKKFKEYPQKQARLKKFSAHWLRHTSATMQDRVGISDKHIQENHRHERKETTERYIHSIDRERHNDMNKLVW